MNQAETLDPVKIKWDTNKSSLHETKLKDFHRNNKFKTVILLSCWVLLKQNWTRKSNPLSFKINWIGNNLNMYRYNKF